MSHRHKKEKRQIRVVPPTMWSHLYGATTNVFTVCRCGAVYDGSKWVNDDEEIKELTSISRLGIIQALTS